MVVWKRACMDVFMTVIDVSFDWIVNNIHIMSPAEPHFVSQISIAWADNDRKGGRIR